MKKFKLNTLLVAIATSPFAAQSFAADEPQNDEVERITVTGSHIKRTDMEGPNPVTSLSVDDLKDTGATDLIGALAKLPVAGAGTFSTQANSSDDPK